MWIVRVMRWVRVRVVAFLEARVLRAFLGSMLVFEEGWREGFGDTWAIVLRDEGGVVVPEVEWMLLFGFHRSFCKFYLFSPIYLLRLEILRWGANFTFKLLALSPNPKRAAARAPAVAFETTKQARR